ncbi:MAG: hypothetical protein ONA90_06235 [candidate division KSB1 bacterium]|nr:hypothetical protein [candidate division KSB1 bacterium]
MARRCSVHLVEWMLIGFIIAVPDLPLLHSQSRPDGAQKNTKQQKAPAPAPSQQPQTEIILPDIYISVPTDSVAVLKRRLEHAENDLQKLRAERNRILKTLEALEKRHRTPPDAPGSRPMGPIVRPSV